MQKIKGYTIHPDATFNKQGLYVGWEYALSADHQFFCFNIFYLSGQLCLHVTISRGLFSQSET